MASHDTTSEEIKELRRENQRLKDEADNAYKNLREVRSQLIQSSKMAAIGQLASGMAHQLNNPLVGVINIAQLLKGKLPNNDPNHKIIEDIISAGRECKSIVEGLLEFVRASEVNFSTVNINDVLDRALRFAENQMAFSSIDIKKEYDPDPPMIRGDEKRLTQAFLNVLINSLQAMGKGGRLTLRTYISTVDEPDLERIHYNPPRRRNDPKGADYRHLRRNPEPELSPLELGQRVMVAEFSDTGPGVPPDHFDKIFDPFFTTKEEGKGVGLGLSVSYGIIQRHRGILFARSTHGEGATFIVKIPVIN